MESNLAGTDALDMALWDAFRFLSLLELLIAAVLLWPESGFERDAVGTNTDGNRGGLGALIVACRREILSVLRARPNLTVKTQVGVVTFSAVAFIWRVVCVAAGYETSRAELGRDAVSLFLVVLLLVLFLGRSVDVAMQLAQFDSVVVDQMKAGETMAALRKERDDMRAEAQNQRESAEKAFLQVETIKKQAQGQADAFMRLMCENKSLQNQLTDYDILMGGSRKKSV